MSIAGHVSRAMLSRHSHVRMEAKRRALDEIAADAAGILKRSVVNPDRRSHFERALARRSGVRLSGFGISGESEETAILELLNKGLSLSEKIRYEFFLP